MEKKDKIKLGQLGERIAREINKRNGWFILPASLSGAGMAAMFDGEKKLILPDDFESKKGNSRWAEIKCKSRSTYSRNDKKWEHGLPLRQWNHYMQVQKHSGIPGYLIIIELNPKPAFLINSLDNLSLKCRIQDMEGEKHIFLHRDAFKISIINNIKMPKGLPPEAESTLSDIESGKYEELKKSNINEWI